MRFRAVMFSCLSCLQDFTICVPCARLLDQSDAKCSKWVFLAYMIPCLAFVVSIPACPHLLSLTYTASSPNLELWMPPDDARCKVQLQDIAVNTLLKKSLHGSLL